jgi:hypothetical protein
MSSQLQAFENKKLLGMTPIEGSLVRRSRNKQGKLKILPLCPSFLCRLMRDSMRGLWEARSPGSGTAASIALVMRIVKCFLAWGACTICQYGHGIAVPIGIKVTAASCLKGVAWRELPPQKGILSPFPASSWPDVVNSGAKKGPPCEILTISQGRGRAEEGGFWRGVPTQPPPLRRGGGPPGLPARRKAFA